MTNNLVQETDGESLTQKAGYIPESEDKEEFDSIEPTEVSTKSSFWNRAGARTIAISGMVFFGLLIFFLMIRTLTVAISNKAKPTEKAATVPKTVEEEQEDIAALKTTIALGSQKAELEKLNSTLSQKAPAPAPTTSTSSAPAPTPQKATLEPRPIQASKPTSEPAPVAVQPKVIYKYAPAPVSAPLPPQPKPKLQLKSRVETVSKKTENTQSKPVTTSTTPVIPTQATSSDKVDPNAIWQAAASVGMYTASQESAVNQITSETKEQKSTTQTAAAPTGVDSNKQGLIVGTRANARLETAFFWTSGSSYQKGQSYLVKLTEDLKNVDGSVAIPKEALVVAQVKSIAPDGWLEMSAVSIVIKSSGSSTGIIEKAIPEEAILIQAKDGSPLRAEYKTVSARPSETATNQLESSDMESNDYSRRVQALQTVLKRKASSQELHAKKNQSEKQANSQGNLPSFTVLTLEKGSAVQIYVNKSFQL